METCIYMVRHGESPKTEGSERSRGLTAKGFSDSHAVTELLKDARIDAFFSSPYDRALLTIAELARAAGKGITLVEDLREISFIGDDRIYPDPELQPLVERMFAESGYAPPGGESLNDCRERALPAFERIVEAHRGQNVVIGTHGVVMTLMMAHFDPRFDLAFLLAASKPDIYGMTFSDGVRVETKRIWKGF